jgi:hypothetical protein
MSQEHYLGTKALTYGPWWDSFHIQTIAVSFPAPPLTDKSVMVWNVDQSARLYIENKYGFSLSQLQRQELLSQSSLKQSQRSGDRLGK